MTRPRFKHCYHVEVVAPDLVFLFSEKGHKVLRGQAMVEVALLLDGQHTEDEIIAQLEARVPLLQIVSTLSLLRKWGYVEDDTGVLPPELAAFWELMGSSATDAHSRLEQLRVTVEALGSVDPEPMMAILATLGILAGDQGNLRLVLTDDYLQPDLEVLNREALDSGLCWMLVKPVGVVPWIGPLFQPGETGCWLCLASRLAANRGIDGYVQRNKGISSPFAVAKARFPSLMQMALNLAATEVAKWQVDGHNSALAGRVLTLDSATLQAETHVLVKRPQCTACGEPIFQAQVHPSPIELRSSPKHYTLDGGHRTLLPETMWATYDYHVSPITGLVSSIESYLEVDNVAHVYGGVYPTGLQLDRWEHARRSLRSTSTGKGLTRDQSRASALGEALERYSGSLFDYDYRKRASYEALGQDAIHPNACMLYSERQYRLRDQINAGETGHDEVPLPLDPTQEIDWTPIWSLTDRAFKYLPTAYCYYDIRTAATDGFCLANSNGCAAGATVEEAILQGFMELVERDCVALWWYNRLQRPAVDLESFIPLNVKHVRAFYEALGREVWAIDLTNDLGIPAFAAFSRRLVGDPGESICLGYGAHFDPQVALWRALTEAAQMLAHVDWARGDSDLQPDPLLDEWLRSMTIANQPYLRPDASVSPRTPADFPAWTSDDLRHDVLKCLEITTAHGLDLLVLDQTRPDIGLNVVRVVVPGLRHFWPRLAPGRLYDVPVQLGWLAEPLSEEQLNPLPCGV